MKGFEEILANQEKSYIFLQEYKKNTYLNMSKNANKYIMYIKKFIDINHDKLFNADFKTFYWNVGKQEDSAIIYQTININEKQITEKLKVLSSMNIINKDHKNINREYFWGLVIAIKYFYDKRQIQNMQLAIIYLALATYSYQYHRYFKFQPNENIMAYTINDMSNRYDIKKLKTIIAVLEKISLGSHEKYKEYLKDENFTDINILNYFINLNTRINNFMKEIFQCYDKTAKSKKYMNTEEDNNDPDNYYEISNISHEIYNLAIKVSNKIITSNINYSICDNCAKLTNVSINEVRTISKKIIDEESEKIKEYILLFLYEYLVVDKYPSQTFASSQFIVNAEKIYLKSNTKDESIIRMKNLLDEWLKKYSAKYLKTERQATLGNYRKAIHLFISISCQQVILGKY